MDHEGTRRTALTVVVEVHPAQAELASDALFGLGTAAVEERLIGDRTVLRAALGDDRAQLESILHSFRWPWRFELVDLAVEDTWRESASATVVDDRIVVVPAWLDVPKDGRDICIAIEPGPTFGLGNHPTTVACLRALRRLVHVGDHVLDVGTGSGVLAVASVLLGAAHAHGIDINPACLDVVRANASANGVVADVSVSLDTPSQLHDAFEVVVANILAPVLRDLASDLVRLTGRCLIVSGLLESSYDDVVAALRPLRLVHREVHEGWVALILER